MRRRFLIVLSFLLATSGALLVGSARAGLPDLTRFMDEDPAWKGLERLYTGGADDLSVHEERREVAGVFSAQRARYETARNLAKKAFADEKWDEAYTHWVTAAGEAGWSRTSAWGWNNAAYSLIMKHAKGGEFNSTKAKVALDKALAMIEKAEASDVGRRLFSYWDKKTAEAKAVIEKNFDYTFKRLP